MEEATSNVEGNGVNGFERVTQKSGNDGPVIIQGLNNGGAEDLDETSVFKKDGSSLQDESMEVGEAEVQLVEGLSKPLAGGTQICRVVLNCIRGHIYHGSLRKICGPIRGDFFN